MKSFLVFFSILCLAAGSSLAAGKHSQGPLAVDADSSSTFQVGDVSFVFPLDTIQVPVYLTTTSLVTYVENSIDWTGTDLTLAEVVPGPGIADTVSFDVIDQTSDNVRFKFTVGGDPVAVGSEPIAYLKFEVQCYGYGAYTYVNLTDDNNYNFFVSGGVPWAPLRDGGRVYTQAETLLYLWSGAATACVGAQDIPMTFTFYQTVPGRVQTVTLQYDNSQFSVDSVEALPGLDGGTATIGYDIGGVLLVNVTSPILPADQIDIFKVHFASVDDTDDIVSAVGIATATWVDACGGNRTPITWGANITIPNHVASADLGDITKYTTSTYYDVPMVMDSNCPINAFELHVQFPADQIYFDQVVASAGFTAPVAGVDPGDTTTIAISNGSGTDYDSSALPATVFYLRFRPWTTPTAGTVFDLTFVDPYNESEIQYWTDLETWHDADFTLVDGSITITNPPPGGGGNPCCPALFVWNGSGYDLENNILAQCDGRDVDYDVTDYYPVSHAVVEDDGVARFQIREEADAMSQFRDFDLLVIDHPTNRAVHVTRDGEIVTANTPFVIKWAKDFTGRDITDLISSRDNVLYASKTSGWFDVSLGALNEDQVDKFAAATFDAQSKRDCKSDGQLNVDGLDKKKVRKLTVSIKDADGNWRKIAETDARHNPARQTALIPPELIRSGEEVVLRYSWDSYYRLDVLEFEASTPFTGDALSAPMIDASRTEDNVVAQRLFRASSQALTLEPGQVIDVAFDVSDLATVPAGYTRDYVFVSTGRYNEPGAGENGAERKRSFALDANVPNPFNPATTIRYSLATATHVELEIYDVRGALVRTLVSGDRPAGEQSVEWNGLSDAGTPMASGVYFYRLHTPEFTQTRKMILLK